MENQTWCCQLHQLRQTGMTAGVLSGCSLSAGTMWGYHLSSSCCYLGAESPTHHSLHPREDGMEQQGSRLTSEVPPWLMLLHVSTGFSFPHQLLTCSVWLPQDFLLLSAFTPSMTDVQCELRTTSHCPMPVANTCPCSSFRWISG